MLPYVARLSGECCRPSGVCLSLVLGKLACEDLRGLGFGNRLWLPDQMKTANREESSREKGEASQFYSPIIFIGG